MVYKFKMRIVHLSVSVISRPPRHMFIAVVIWTITLEVIESQDADVVQPSCEELCDVQQLARDFYEADCSENNYDSVAEVTPCTGVDKITLRNNQFRRLHNLSSSVWFPRVTELDISENSIRVIDAGAFGSFPNVNLLSLMDLEVGLLVDHIFEGLPMLKKLYMFSGRIEVIEPLAFAGLGRVTTIDLSYNKIRSLPANLFRATPNLESLTLSYNKLQRLPIDMFPNLPELRKLELDQNYIVNISEHGIEDLGHLDEVNLDYNYLTEIPNIRTRRLSVASNRFETFKFPDNVTWERLHLHDNPLNCDHRLESLRKWMREDRERVGPPLICSTPLGAMFSLEELESLTTTPPPTTLEITTEPETTVRGPLVRGSTEFNLKIEKGFTSGNNDRWPGWDNGSSNLSGLSVMTLVLLSAAAALIT